MLYRAAPCSVDKNGYVHPLGAILPSVLYDSGEVESLT